MDTETGGQEKVKSSSSRRNTLLFNRMSLNGNFSQVSMAGKL